MIGDKIQINGKIKEIVDGQKVVEIAWCRSIELIKPGIARKEEINKAKNQFTVFLKEVCSDLDPEKKEKRKSKLANFLVEIWDNKQMRIKLSSQQFNLLQKVIEKYYGELPLNQQPIILSLMKTDKLEENLQYLIEFAKAVGTDIIFSSKNDFRQSFLNFYLEENDETLSKIENVHYPFLLLNDIFIAPEIGQILQILIKTKKPIYNQKKENLTFEQTFIFDTILKSINTSDIPTAMSLFEFLLQNIAIGNYQKRIPNENPQNEKLFGKYDEGLDNFFEFEISSALKSFLYKLKENNRKDLIQVLIAKNGLIEKVIATLELSDTYRYPYKRDQETGEDTKSHHYRDLIIIGKKLLKL